MLLFAHDQPDYPAVTRRRFACLAAALLALAALGLTVVMQDSAAPLASATKTVEFPRAELVVATTNGELRLDVEIARTLEQRAKGLMYRTSLAPDGGMLFIYGPPPREVTMWMRNTILSLDMLFIAADGRVARIVANTTPMSEATIESREPVAAVLELLAGSARRLGIRPGDRIDLTPFAP